MYLEQVLQIQHARKIPSRLFTGIHQVSTPRPTLSSHSILMSLVNSARYPNGISLYLLSVKYS